MKLIIDYYCEHYELEIGYMAHEIDEKGEPIDIQVSVDKEELDILEEAGFLGNFREIPMWDYHRLGCKQYMALIARLPEWHIEGYASVTYQGERL